MFLGIGPLADDEHIVATVQRLLADAACGGAHERLRCSIDAAAPHGSATASAACCRAVSAATRTPRSRCRSRARAAAAGRLPGDRRGRRQPQQLRRARDRDGPAGGRGRRVGDQVPALQGRHDQRSATRRSTGTDPFGTDYPVRGVPALRPSRLRRLRRGRGRLPRARHRVLRDAVRPPAVDALEEHRTPPSTRSPAATSPTGRCSRPWRRPGKPLLLSTGAATLEEIRRRSSGPGSAPSGWCCSSAR